MLHIVAIIHEMKSKLKKEPFLIPPANLLHLNIVIIIYSQNKHFIT